MGGLRILIFRLVSAALSLIAMAFVLEVGLRLFWEGHYLRVSRDYLEFHPTRGWTPRKSFTGEFGKPEFSHSLVHNAHGFRMPELDVAKPPGRVRVLALGDSMVYGLGVENDETFSARLEQLDGRLQVINAGVPAYSPAEELLMLREEGLALSPDVVLINFFPNDLADAYKGTYSRFYVENGGVRIAPPEDPSQLPGILRPKRVRHPTLSKSYAYRFVSDRLKILRYWARDTFDLWQDDPDLIPAAEVEQAWTLVYGLVRQIARDARAQGAEPILVIIPASSHVNPELSVVGVDKNATTVQARLSVFAAEIKLPVVDLLPEFRASLERDGEPLYYRFDGHLNEHGHQRLAEIVLTHLLALGLLPPS